MEDIKMYNEQLLERLESALAKKNLSQVKAATEIGISTSVLSQYRRTLYEGDVKSVEAKIQEWLINFNADNESVQKQVAYGVENYAYTPTSISEDIYKRIEYCRLQKGMVILHGDAGIGKTKAAEKYAIDHPTSCIYLQVAPSAGSLGNLLKMLAEELKVSQHYNRYILSTRIKQKLVSTNRVLILDEAQHLKLSCLEELRNISDPDDRLKEPGSGIVLIGNTEVYNRMMGKQSANFAQMFSRIKMQRYYSTADIKEVDIKEVFTYLAKNELKRELDFMLGVSRSKWGMRGAVNVYNNAVNNDDVSFKGLYTAAHELGVGVL